MEFHVNKSELLASNAAQACPFVQEYSNAVLGLRQGITDFFNALQIPFEKVTDSHPADGWIPYGEVGEVRGVEVHINDNSSDLSDTLRRDSTLCLEELRLVNNPSPMRYDIGLITPERRGIVDIFLANGDPDNPHLGRPVDAYIAFDIEESEEYLHFGFDSVQNERMIKIVQSYIALVDNCKNNLLSQAVQDRKLGSS